MGGDEVGRADEGSAGLRLPVALALAVIAGFVDAVGFLHLFGVFAANQSGNVVFFGMSISEASPAPAWASGGAMLGFLAGTAGGRLLSDRLPSRRRAPTLLALELALLVVLAASVVAIAPQDGLLADGPRLVLLLIASLAMGIQTEEIRRAAGVAVATTYQTGAIARIGESLGSLPGSPDRADTRHAAVVLSIVLASYIGGAALGASRLGEGHFGLVLPCLALAIVLAVILATSADRPAPTDEGA